MDRNNNMIQFPSIKGDKKFSAESFKEENILGTKITQARKQQGISQAKLSEILSEYELNVSAKTISKWEKGMSLPNPPQLFALCYSLKIDNPLTYFTGSAPEPLDFSPELNAAGMNLLQIMKQALISSGEYTPKERSIPYSEPIIEIPMKVCNEPAAAGPGNFDIEGSYEMISFPESSIPVGSDFGVRVSGISMYPRYTDKQIVWVQKKSELHNGEIGIFLYDENMYIKKYIEEEPSPEEKNHYIGEDGRKYPKITLYSLNRDCADLDVHVEIGHQFIIIGKVLN